MLLSRIHIVGAGVAIALFIAFLLFFRSRLGIRLRAISDDYMASWSVGISVERGVGLSWGLASIVAVATGVIWGEIQGVDRVFVDPSAQGADRGRSGRAGQYHRRNCRRYHSWHSGKCRFILSGWDSRGGSRDLIVAAVLILTVMIRPHGLFGRHDIERV